MSTSTNPVNKVDTEQIDYTGYAKSYDQSRHIGRRNAYHERIRFRAFSRLTRQLPRDSRILDAGCGTGRGLGYLARSGYTNLTGLDYTAAMLEHAEKNLTGEFPQLRIPLMRGDAFNLPFEEGTFDCVVTFNFLHMFRFDLQQKLIAEMTRVVKPGGLIVAEFESIHKGLVFTRYLEQRRVKARTKFNSVGEISQLFDRSRYRDVRIAGAGLPKAYLAFERFPRLGECVESVAYLPGVKWLAERVIVAARRA